MRASMPPGSPQPAPPSDSEPLEASYDEAVRELLRRTLESTGGRIYGPAGAAAALGLKPTTLQAKLKKYGLQRGSR
jgi:formate hydrogenlyase transcriptional activator